MLWKVQCTHRIYDFLIIVLAVIDNNEYQNTFQDAGLLQPLSMLVQGAMGFNQSQPWILDKEGGEVARSSTTLLAYPTIIASSHDTQLS